MFLQCKVCGSAVNWEDLVLGHLVRDVYRCINKKCHRSILHYVEPNKPLPEWVEGNIEYRKAN